MAIKKSDLHSSLRASCDPLRGGAGSTCPRKAAGPLVHEVPNHRHDARRRIPEDRWCRALGWMRDTGFVPHGLALP